MTVFQTLENFAASRPASTSSRADIVDDASLEEAKLASFESGYKAGWDDALKAQADDKAKVAADLSRNLEDLNFTYQEALSAMVNAVTPVMMEAMDRLLPDIAQNSLALKVRECLETMLRSQGEQVPVEIHIAPQSSAVVQDALPEISGLPLSLVEDATLAEGQATLKLGTQESFVDVAGVAEQIRAALAGFQHELQTDRESA